jgi:hypothetical protein
MKIIQCKIKEGKTKNQVIVRFSDRSVSKLFDYNPSELAFSDGAFVGLTELEAFMLRAQKETNYLTRRS